MDELLKHILLEFQIHNKMLDEKHGRIPQIQQYIYDLFENAIFPMEQMMKSNNDTIRAEVFHKDIFPNCDCFFTHCNIDITLSLDNKSSFRGGYYPKKSFYSDTTSFVTMKITVGGKDFNDINNSLRFVFAHELTHAYDDYCKTMHYGTISSKIDIDARKNNYYNTVNLHGFSQNQDAMCDILNRLSPLELKAYIGQFEAEIKPNVDKIKDAVSAWELAKETIAWNKLDYLERSIKILNSITDKDYQNHLLTYYNNVYPLKPLSTYNQLLKTLNGRFYKFKRIFINRISKILYDLYSENNIIIS